MVVLVVFFGCCCRGGGGVCCISVACNVGCVSVVGCVVVKKK